MMTLFSTSADIFARVKFQHRGDYAGGALYFFIARTARGFDFTASPLRLASPRPRCDCRPPRPALASLPRRFSTLRRFHNARRRFSHLLPWLAKKTPDYALRDIIVESPHAFDYARR